MRVLGAMVADDDDEDEASIGYGEGPRKIDLNKLERSLGRAEPEMMHIIQKVNPVRRALCPYMHPARDVYSHLRPLLHFGDMFLQTGQP